MATVTIHRDLGVRLKVEKVYMNIQRVKNVKCKLLYDFTNLSLTPKSLQMVILEPRK